MPVARRSFLLGAAATGILASTARAAPAVAPPFTLPPLPYPADGLAPVISGQTLGFHHGKHHQAYVDNLNQLVAGSEMEKHTLDAVVRATNGTDKVAIFNNAAQASHHAFYWNSMRPGGGGAPPTGQVANLISRSFGGFDRFKVEFTEKAAKLFGSGWCWLVLDGEVAKVVQTRNADLPSGRPILVIDVWEHAYYLDYQNRRSEYVTAWLDRLVNWEFATKNLDTR